MRFDLIVYSKNGSSRKSGIDADNLKYATSLVRAVCSKGLVELDCVSVSIVDKKEIIQIWKRG